jgi:hypothetical protein
MEAQYVNIAFLPILNTGAIPDTCRDWQRRTPMNQTWAEFRREFDRAQMEKRIISSTASGQAITQPMWQNNMNIPQRLQTRNVLLPWPTWPLLHMLTAKQ